MSRHALIVCEQEEMKTAYNTEELVILKTYNIFLFTYALIY